MRDIKFRAGIKLLHEERASPLPSARTSGKRSIHVQWKNTTPLTGSKVESKLPNRERLLEFDTCRDWLTRLAFDSWECHITRRKITSKTVMNGVRAMANATGTLKTAASLAFLLLCPFSSSWAQLHPANAMGVTMGQLHYSVRDVESNRKFWIAFGGTPTRKINDMEAVKFPGVVILLSHGDPLGGTEGSVINHVGFRVPSVAKTVEQMKAAGYSGERSATYPTGNVYSPDGERIELLEALSSNLKFTLDGGREDFEAQRNNRAIATAIEFHHVHYNVPASSVKQIKAWYVKMFGAVPGQRLHYEAADLPGAEVDIQEVAVALAPTKGRALDHIGFEVKNLREFCKKLQVNGVKFTSPYEKHSSGVATAEFPDPWGVTIELSEGLDRL